MSENGFPTVAVTEILEAGLAPHTLPPAPYVLVVDDERPLTNLLAIVLRSEGYAVSVAYDAESAIEIAELAPPQLLVTDFDMPGMNGVELAYRLQELIPECQVIITTGLPELATACLGKMGANLPVFTKPVEAAELLKAVSELLLRAGQQLPGSVLM